MTARHLYIHYTGKRLGRGGAGNRGIGMGLTTADSVDGGRARGGRIVDITRVLQGATVVLVCVCVCVGRGVDKGGGREVVKTKVSKHTHTHTYT